MSTKVRELRAERAEILDAAQALLDKAASEKRGLNRQEKRSYDGMVYRAEQLMDEIENLEGGFGPGKGRELAMRLMGGDRVNRAGVGGEFGQVEQAVARYIRSGDESGLRDLRIANDGEYPCEIRLPRFGEMRATDEIMNVTTAADGGAAVPTGFAGQIAARRSEAELAIRLGCMPVPGGGLTVNFPVENADHADFALTSEQVDNYSNTYERDRPTLATKAFTLAKYTKKIALTEELELDEDANLMAFIANHVGRAIASTNNSLLLTEVAANGTALKTFASASAIAVDELEDVAFGDTISYYTADGGPSVAWVMRPSTYSAILKLDDTSIRRYAPNVIGGSMRTLLEFPVQFSNKVTAIQASAKSLYYGDWRSVGYRSSPSLKLVRDPYSTDGVVLLKYMFRSSFGVLTPGIGYAQHPSA